MSEDQQTPSPDESKEGEPSSTKSKTRPVTTYLIVLFMAALLLLLLSFFMQQRNHQALMDLNTNMTASETLNELELANQQLEFQLEDANRQLEELKKKQEELSAQIETAKKQAEALEWLREIENAVQASSPTAKELVEKFQATGLEKYLPSEPLAEGSISPAEIYRNIYATLF